MRSTCSPALSHQTNFSVGCYRRRGALPPVGAVRCSRRTQPPLPIHPGTARTGCRYGFGRAGPQACNETSSWCRSPYFRRTVLDRPAPVLDWHRPPPSCPRGIIRAYSSGDSSTPRPRCRILELRHPRHRRQIATEETCTRHPGHAWAPRRGHERVTVQSAATAAVQPAALCRAN